MKAPIRGEIADKNGLVTTVWAAFFRDLIKNATGALTGAISTVLNVDLTPNKAVISNADGKIAASSVSSDEIAYLEGATSNIQDQLNTKIGSSFTIEPATKTKVTYNLYGQIVLGEDATTTDIAEGTNLYYTDERAQDAIGSILTDTAELDFTYDDATPTITADLKVTTVTAGSYGSASQVPNYTVDTKGRLTAAANTTIAIASTAVTDFTEASQDAVGAMVDASLVYIDATPLLQRAALTGDITASAGSNATTLATVNSNVGSFGTASSVATVTVNAKGLTTAASNTAIQISESQVTNLTTDLAAKVATSSLGNLTDAGTDGITITGGTGAVVGSVSVAQHVADSTHNGYLSSTDWSTFNNKQAAISLTTTGASGASTFTSNTLNVPTYTLAGLGGVSSTLTNTHVLVGNGSNVATDVAVSGDATIANTGALTLATVATAATKGSASKTVTATINVKGLTTSLTDQDIQITESQVTNLTSDLAAKEILVNKATDFTTVNNTLYPTVQAVNNAINTAIAGVNPAIAVQAATTAAGNTSGFTYSNGVSGIGATLTGVANTALTVDGYTFTAVGQRLLVKNDTQSPSGAFNGVYYVTQIQTALVPIILTRSLDYNQPSDINNTGAIPVVNGTVNGITSWVLTSQVTTVGTDPLTYTKFSVNPATLLTTSLTSAHLLVGNGSNLATDTAITGDVTITNTGVTAIGATKVTNAMLAGSIAASKLIGSDIATVGTITTGTWTGTKVNLAYGGTNADLSATGGTGQYLKQSSSGAAVTVGTIPASDIASGAALTKTNDTNVTLTLGGSPTTALLAASSLTLGWTGTLAETRGGTNQSTYALGDTLYSSAANTLSKLSGNTTTTRKFLRQTGNGSVSAAPAWDTLVAGDIPDISGTYVPYTGASSDVNIGAHNYKCTGYYSSATTAEGTSFDFRDSTTRGTTLGYSVFGQVAGGVNGSVDIEFRNLNTHVAATSDLTLTSDNSGNYGGVGIANSTYNQAGFSAYGAYCTYMYSALNDVVINASTAGKVITLVTGTGDTSGIRAKASDSGFHVYGATAYGVMCGPTASNGALQSTAAGTLNYVLTGNGSALPTFQNLGMQSGSFTVNSTTASTPAASNAVGSISNLSAAPSAVSGSGSVVTVVNSTSAIQCTVGTAGQFMIWCDGNMNGAATSPNFGYQFYYNTAANEFEMVFTTLSATANPVAARGYGAIGAGQTVELKWRQSTGTGQRTTTFAPLIFHWIWKPS